jgi:hypothetical protein
MTSSQENPSTSNFAELSEAECKELLAQHNAWPRRFHGTGRSTDLAGDLSIPKRQRDLPHLPGRSSVGTGQADQRRFRNRWN